MSHKYTNALITETSPYLLQHAHNPVNWEAWKPEVLARAQKENKLILISIGYAACHWCHVMEHECFEDEVVAAIMNSNFINIKVDREERPDVDHIYMDALQMMTGSGGWPLNIIALPDGRPFWGATYVKKDDWIQILAQLTELCEKNRTKVEEYAQNLTEGIQAINLIENNQSEALFTADHTKAAVATWSSYFDTFLGGYKRAPKFMMPVNLNFLLHYGSSQNDTEILDYVNTTLTKMAWGGIFDQVGGGFSRYSVDTKWHVPHFEKMLYDNGQLISLYAQAYAATKNELYKRVVEKTIEFTENELLDKNCGFYSSLDADSLTDQDVLEEGAYYVWQEKELKVVLGDSFTLFKDYFNINSYGHWEHGNYVLIRDADDAKLANKHKLSVAEIQTAIGNCLALLKAERSKRNRPRLDDKILTSWNGLMLKGLVDAYRYLGNGQYLELALKNAAFIEENLSNDDGGLFHNYKNGTRTINGFLEDYATIINAYIALYEVSFDEKWLDRAKALTNYTLDNFRDSDSKLFFFTSEKDAHLIRRTLETSDNVIPASNSIMAINLFKLSRFYADEHFENIAKEMLKSVQNKFQKMAQNHANWMQLAVFLNQDFYEVAVVGDGYNSKALEIASFYLPNTILAASATETRLPLFEGRKPKEDTLIYVCQYGSCQLPTADIAKAITLLK